MSHPVRVRGLKHPTRRCRQRSRFVAPRAGAWIETSCSSKLALAVLIVAPRAGAWIETILGLLYQFYL